MAIMLTGRLLCASAEEAGIVSRHLPRHVELTRAEPGCLSFDVTASADPLVWDVSERFADRAAFDAHQARVAASGWGRATAGIRRDYVVRDDPDGVTPRSDDAASA
ncbi:putative quinol monooxygenase [Microbacterium sp. NPDC055683]